MTNEYCRELLKKAPSCFEPVGIIRSQGAVMPNYAVAYFCLWELLLYYGMSWRDIWYDDKLIETVLQCRRSLRH